MSFYRKILERSLPQEEIDEIILVDHDYTEEILEKLSRRPFQSRLYISSSLTKTVSDTNDGVYEGGFLRTRFSDRAAHQSDLSTIRDYIWALYSREEARTKDAVAAKLAISHLCLGSFKMDESEYYSFASTLASALSEQATNTVFQPKEFLKTEDLHLVRKKFVLCMEILFQSVSLDRFLVQDNAANIYRLAYCMRSTMSYDNSSQGMLVNGRRIFFAPLLSFALQVVLLVYVILEIEDTLEDEKFELQTKTLPLAALGSIYSSLLAWKRIKTSLEINKFYESVGFLWFLDYVINVILPILAIFAGFFVIALNDSYIEGVLNTAALLFVSEIDDELPEYLDLDPAMIVHTYLIENAIHKLNKLKKYSQITGNIEEKFAQKAKHPADIEYSDIIVTNMEERGSDPSNHVFFAPLNISDFAASTHITGGCLLKEISWIYQPSYHRGSAKLSAGYVSYLRAVTLADNKVIEFTNPNFMNEMDTNQYDGSVQGVYIITKFEKKRNITKLRICGSKTKEDFKKAMEYYSLWDLSPVAASLLR